MKNGNHLLMVEGTRIQLRLLENVRLVTPARNEHPVRVAMRLARSTRLALDSTYPDDSLVVWGERTKLEELSSYPDIQNTRCAFKDPDDNLFLLTNEILIRFVEGSSEEGRDQLLAQLDGRVVGLRDAVWKFRVNDRAEDAPLLLSNEISGESIVEYAEPNALQALTIHRMSQDAPQSESQWHLRNSGRNRGHARADVDALGAWKITRGSPNVSVVIHDCGVDIHHPDLASNVNPGWDFDNDDSDPSNAKNSHGTTCAGIIAGTSKSGGLSGIAPECRLIPLKAAGAHTWQTWADTFDWAAERGQIISCGWSITPSNTVSAAIRRTVKSGVLVFCATGNGAPATTGIAYPARMPETIAVGASTNEDVRASYSQFGEGIDFVAPSGGGTRRIETTDIRGPRGYNTAASASDAQSNADDDTGFEGTSGATALAAGIGALILSVNPDLTADQVRKIMRETADKADADGISYSLDGWHEQYGFGRINANKAVERTRERLTICGDGTSDLIVRNEDGELRLYPFLEGSFHGHFGGKRVAHGFHHTHYFVGNWTGCGTDELLVRTEDGDMLFYPFRDSTFYGHGDGMKVAHGFDYTHYFVGNWTGNGTDDLLVRTEQGDMLLYPFDNGTFYGHGGGVKVGRGFDFTHYLVGNWTGDGTDDLIVRSENGDMLLYPFRDGTFYGHGGATKVGEGFNYTHYFVGNWTGDGTDDLIVRSENGDVLLYPFHDGTFRGQGGGAWVGEGFNFTHYLVGKWTGNGTDDMLVRTKDGDMLLFPFRNNTFYGHGGGRKVGEGFDFTHYLVGNWLK
jgi:hypothetical protein